jgi:hypothetical protein
MTTQSPPSRRQAVLVCFAAVVTALMCAGVCAAAVLVPAPATVVPVVVAVCVGCPMFAAWELPKAVSALRMRRRKHDARALAALRRSLEQLPETEHPLGL